MIVLLYLMHTISKEVVNLFKLKTWTNNPHQHECSKCIILLLKMHHNAKYNFPSLFTSSDTSPVSRHFLP